MYNYIVYIYRDSVYEVDKETKQLNRICRHLSAHTACRHWSVTHYQIAHVVSSQLGHPSIKALSSLRFNGNIVNLHKRREIVITTIY